MVTLLELLVRDCCVFLPDRRPIRWSPPAADLREVVDWDDPVTVAFAEGLLSLADELPPCEPLADEQDFDDDSPIPFGG